VCVVASETKNYINVRTVYRTTPIADQHFLDLLPKLTNELKIHENSNVKAAIVNNSARMKYLQTNEYMDLQLFFRTIYGNNPFVQGETLEKVKEQKSVLMPKILEAAAATRLRCNDIEYYVTTGEKNESRSNINDFVLESNKSYSLQLSFDNMNDKTIDKKRAVTLREYGIDIEKYEHDLNIEKHKATLTIDFSHFSAAENPWAIRKNKKNLSFGSFDLEETEQ